MKREISEETIKKTTRCEKCFSCLSGTRTDMCQVELRKIDVIYYVMCLSDEICSYRAPLHGKLICLCPTRRELYDRYKI